MVQERRRFFRVPFDVRARLHVAGKELEIQGIRNLSMGGSLLSLKAQVSPGVPCKLVIQLEGSRERLKISGEVTRNTGDTVAVKFTGIDPESLHGIDPESLHHLRNIVRYNAPDPETVEKEFSERPGLL
ncbi:MAG: PilZ domain-containing protein [Deltaproteobacteria bacterium]|nr:PilZ domain-containing protein [Deltaproteobacteria bacterium]